MGSLAFVCCPCLFPFGLGKGLWPKVGLSPIFLNLHLHCPLRMRPGREALTFYLNAYWGFRLPSSLPHRPFFAPSQFSSPTVASPPLVGSSLHSDYASRRPGPASQVGFTVIIKKRKIALKNLGCRSVFQFFPLLVMRNGCLRVSCRRAGRWVDWGHPSWSVNYLSVGSGNWVGISGQKKEDSRACQAGRPRRARRAGIAQNLVQE